MLISNYFLVQNFWIRNHIVFEARTEWWKCNCITNSASFEFFYNSLIPAKSWQDPASIDGQEKNKTVVSTGDWTHDLQIISLMLFWLCQQRIFLVACVNHSAFIKSLIFKVGGLTIPALESTHTACQTGQTDRPSTRGGSRGGGRPSQEGCKPIIWPIFSWKMHENERICTQKGACVHSVPL